MSRIRLKATLLAIAGSLMLSGCGSPSSEPDLSDKVRLASEMAASIGATSATSTPSAQAEGSASPKATKKEKAPQPTESASSNPAVDYASLWQQYPWGSDGLECSPPGASPGISANPGDPTTVIVMGDSLIRNARTELTEALTARGYSPVFVCWGGKTLTWGQEQVAYMRDAGLLPSCLVINLGTNDLKGTTAAGLSDAVDLETVSTRLESLLTSIADVDDVFAVDLAANLAIAPSTMSRVEEAPAAYHDVVSRTGIGAVVDWSSEVSQDPSLVGEDGIHDSDAGRAVRAELIADAVARDCR